MPAVLGQGETDGRGEGVDDAIGTVFPDLEERLWVPPVSPAAAASSSPSTTTNGHAAAAKGVNQLSDPDIDKFLVVARSVGTFARALDCSSSVKQPSLHMSAAAASRDITLFHAYELLHQHGYDTADTLKALVPDTGTTNIFFLT